MVLGMVCPPLKLHGYQNEWPDLQRLRRLRMQLVGVLEFLPPPHSTCIIFFPSFLR